MVWSVYKTNIYFVRIRFSYFKNKQGHCKKLAPTWHELGVKYMSSGKAKISQLDCTQNAIICQDQGVRGYPALIFFHDGKQVN